MFENFTSVSKLEASLKGKNLLPEGGSKFFPLKVAPILEAISYFLWEQCR